MTNGKVSAQPIVMLVASFSLSLNSHYTTSQSFSGDEPIITEIIIERGKQLTPSAVSSTNSTAIKQEGFDDLYELGLSVPSLVMEYGAGSGNAAAPFIRGIGQRDTRPFQSPGVNIIVDGVHYSRPDGALIDLHDVHTVDVHRGPQGVLFGRNTAGGAIVVTTQAPQPKFAAELTYGGGNLSRNHLSGIINTPITKSLSARLAISTTERDGYTHRVDDNNVILQDTDDINRESGNLKIRWQANADLSIQLQAALFNQDETGRGAGCFNINQIQNTPAATDIFFNLAAVPIPITFYQALAPEVLQSVADRCNPSALDLDNNFNSSLESIYENDSSHFAADINFNAGEWLFLDDLEIHSKTAFRSVETTQNLDLDGTDVPLFDRVSDAPQESDQISQELTLTFKMFNQLLSGQTGVYFQTESTEVTNSLRSGPFPITAEITDTISGGLFPRDIYNSFISTHDRSIWETDNQHLSFFTHLKFELTDLLELSGGFRYSRERKKLDLANFSLAPISGSGTFGLNGLIPEAGNLSFNQLASQINATNLFLGYSGLNLSQFDEILPTSRVFFQPVNTNTPISNTLELVSAGSASANDVIDKTDPLFTISYLSNDKVNEYFNIDSALAYAAFSGSYKSGGLLPSSTISNTSPLNSIGIAGSPLDVFDAENVSNYELGFKLSALDHRMHLSVNTFLTKYKDIQINGPGFDSNNTFIAQELQDNSASATIFGIEIEGNLHKEKWLLRYGASFLDGEYDSFNYNVGRNLNNIVIDRSNEDLPYLSEWQLNFSAAYRHTSRLGVITPQLSLNYNSGYSAHNDSLSFFYGVPELTGFIIIGDFLTSAAETNFTVVNQDEFRISEYLIVNAQLRWDIFNEHASITAWVRNAADKQFRTNISATPDSYGVATFGLSPPRTYGIDLTIRF